MVNGRLPVPIASRMPPADDRANTEKRIFPELNLIPIAAVTSLPMVSKPQKPAVRSAPVSIFSPVVRWV
jgi:hypothetical protein